jgi:iron complex outermembrane receptor protein
MQECHTGTKLFWKIKTSAIFATMLQKGFVSSCFLFLFWHSSPAQNCQNAIRGTVFSASVHTPLPFVAIRLPQIQQQIFTNERGWFEICDLKPGKYQLVLRQIGFDSLILSAETGGKKLILHLEERDRWLNAVDVKGKHRHFESEVVENSALHGPELEQNRGVSLGELLRKIPGVSAIQTGPGIFKPIIQGMTGQRIAVIQNGVKLEGQQWGFEHAPETDPGMADEIVVVRGAQSVRYGSEAMGGLILLEPGEIKTQGRPEIRLNSGYFSNGRGFSQGLRLQQSHEKGHHRFDWRVSANGRKSGSFHSARYVLGNTALEEYSSSVLFRHQAGKKWKNEVSASYVANRPGIFSGAHISSQDGIRQAINRPDSTYRYDFSYAIQRPKQELAHLLLKTRSRYRWTEQQETSLNISYQRDIREEFDIIRRSAACQTCPQLYFELQNRQAELVHQVKREGEELSFGVTGQYQSNVVQRSILVPNFRLWQGAVFGSAAIYRGDFAWEAGIRAEFRHQQIFRYEGDFLNQPVRQFFYGMASAGGRWEISHHWHARLNLQLSQRPPSVSELYSRGVHHGSASYEMGAENMKPESALGMNGSVHHESEHLDVLVNFFTTYSSNYIYLSPVKDSIWLTIRGPFPFFQYRQTDVRMLGGDVQAVWKVSSSWQLLTQGSLIRSQDLDANQPLIFQPADRCSFNLRWISPVRGDGGWQLQAEAGPELVARQNRAPDTDFAPPPSGYQLWNGRISLRKTTGKCPFEASLEGRNLSNAAYRDYLNRFRYFALDTGRNLLFRISLTI